MFRLVLGRTRFGEKKGGSFKMMKTFEWVIMCCYSNHGSWIRLKGLKMLSEWSVSVGGFKQAARIFTALFRLG